MANDENGAASVVEGNPSGGLLNNLRVLDLGQGVSGPYCARLLADQGAAVIKVEPPEGDPARRMGPFVGDEPHGEKSIPFLYLNTNKRSITLNLSTAAGRTLLHSLVRWADVLVENFEPRLLASLGLDDESLREVNAGLVVTSITSFGSNGPYSDWKATDLVTSAVSGIMYPFRKCRQRASPQCSFTVPVCRRSQRSVCHLGGSVPSAEQRARRARGRFRRRMYDGSFGAVQCLVRLHRRSQGTPSRTWHAPGRTYAMPGRPRGGLRTGIPAFRGHR